MTPPDRLRSPHRTGGIGRCPFELIVSHHDKATVTGGWVVPDNFGGGAIPQCVDDAVAALGHDDAFQIIGNDKDAVDEAGRRLHQTLANTVEHARVLPPPRRTSPVSGIWIDDDPPSNVISINKGRRAREGAL